MTMIRTTEKFNEAIKSVKSYHNMHKKSIWLVPTDDDYAISIIKPNAGQLPAFTAAILYDTNLNIEDEVESSKHL
jgi:hypothetical protein